MLTGVNQPGKQETVSIKWCCSSLLQSVKGRQRLVRRKNDWPALACNHSCWRSTSRVCEAPAQHSRQRGQENDHFETSGTVLPRLVELAGVVGEGARGVHHLVAARRRSDIPSATSCPGGLLAHHQRGRQGVQQQQDGLQCACRAQGSEATIPTQSSLPPSKERTVEAAASCQSDEAACVHQLRSTPRRKQ